MTWESTKNKIDTDIVPGKTGILKCRGTERRLVTALSKTEIHMRTGVKSKQEKKITFTMVKRGFETLQSVGRFTSEDFRAVFGKEYKDAPCRYSMTGGVLVEIGVARRVPGSNDKSCYYDAVFRSRS